MRNDVQATVSICTHDVRRERPLGRPTLQLYTPTLFSVICIADRENSQQRKRNMNKSRDAVIECTPGVSLASKMDQGGSGSEARR
eukprot:m.42288 g.42288  ORF g.42288 m.42288 type:complete len:85 (-) comp8304_c0_seq1:551-805(-)